MASIRDSYKLIAAAMNWDGGKEVMAELTKDIAIASNDAKEREAVRMAASLLLADSRLRPMQRAQCEVALATTVFEQSEAKLHVGRADTEFEKVENMARDANKHGIRMLGIDELRQQISQTRKGVDTKKKTNAKRALPQDPGRPRPTLSNGVVKPLLPLATFSSAYATATGRLTQSGEGSMFTIWSGNTVLRCQDQSGDYPLSLRRADVTRIFYSESSPLIMISAQSSRICDGQCSIEFADCENMMEFVRQFNGLASKLTEDKFKIYVAEACKEIRVRKAELELAALRGS